MKILKRLSAILVVIGIALVIAGPVWSRFQSSRMRSLQQQMEDIVSNPENISANNAVHKEFAKNMAVQMGRIGDAVKHAMRIVYFGVLCSIIGLGGVTLCLNQEIKSKGIPNKSLDRTSG